MIVSGGSTNESENIQAYSYALTERMMYNESGGQEGAFVVVTNGSWGVEDPTNSQEFPVWCAVYDALGEAGILNVSAAPNKGIDIDQNADFPARCDSEYLIMVTNVDEDGDLVTDAAFGANTIDIGAFGQNIWTTQKGNTYGSERGTSLSAPLVAGTIGLLYSSPCVTLKSIADSDPGAAAALAKEYVFEGLDLDGTLLGRTTTGGRLNTLSTIDLYLNACQSCNAPTSLTTTSISPNSHTIEWSVNDSIVRVDLRWRKAGTPTWTIIEDLEGGLMLSELTACTSYEIQLKTYCQSDTLDFANSRFFQTDGCCEPPLDAELFFLSDNSALIGWSAITAASSYNVRYRVKDASVWEAIATENDNILIRGLQNCTDYEVQIQTNCDTALTEYSPSLFFLTDGCGGCLDNEYCQISNGDSNEGEWINEVAINGFSNKSGRDADTYADYTSFATTSLSQDSTYEMLLIPGFDGRAFDQFFSVFIDFNQNGEFSTDERVFRSASGARDTVKAEISIPTDAIEGSTRMRVFMNFNTAGGPCRFSGNQGSRLGEVEDYCITIAKATVACCIPSGLDTMNTTSTSLQLEWSDEQCGHTAYALQYRPLSGGEWITDITASTAIDIEDLSPCTAYEVQIQGLCNEQFSDFSASSTFVTGCLTDLDEVNETIINVFPNPVSDQLIVSLPNSFLQNAT
ncbi:MAG: fibronectin type III domain-containing protein, partial [Bacteroidota bacterium]